MLRPDEPALLGAALRHHGVVRQELDRAVELPRLLHGVHEPRLGVEPLGRLRLRQRERQALQVIVAQHMGRHVVGALAQNLIALLQGEIAGGHGSIEEYLEIDLVVAGIDARGIVDGVGVDLAAFEVVFDAGLLREPEVGALPHHRAGLRWDVPGGFCGRRGRPAVVG